MEEQGRLRLHRNNKAAADVRKSRTFKSNVGSFCPGRQRLLRGPGVCQAAVAQPGENPSGCSAKLASSRATGLQNTVENESRQASNDNDLPNTWCYLGFPCLSRCSSVHGEQVYGRNILHWWWALLLPLAPLSYYRPAPSVSATVINSAGKTSSHVT